MPFVHTPVLESEALAQLQPRAGRTYCDATLGGGGHAHAILEQSGPDGRLIGIDRDPIALEAARVRLAEFAERVVLVHGRFGDIDLILDDLGVPAVDGLLIDIGTSSPQFDDPERGFSFLRDGPIDMRMDPSSGQTALELMRRASIEELARILREYGEEKYSKRIAERIKERLRKDELETTTQLAQLVEAAIPAKVRYKMKIHPATRTFQALRIAVNQELDELAAFLAKFPERLNPGGRCVVISFHSLEDRLVKRRFRELAFTSSLPPEFARQVGEPVNPVCVPLTKKPIFASESELAANPRARSARLRACQKWAPAESVA
jgi:16S rRNA (cytosine1402-N4)-methyltransferase